MNEVKAILSEKDKKIEVLNSQVTLLQNHVSTVKHAFDKKVDELEQYGRRVCLRIEGVEHQVNEKSEEVLEKVVNIIKESEAKIPESVLDRAHRVGPTILPIIQGKRCKALLSDSRHLDKEPYFMQIAKILNLVPEVH